MDLAAVCHSIPFEEMGENENDKIADGDQSYDTGVLERIKTAKERQRNDNQPAGLVSSSSPESSGKAKVAM